jgi:hypothetical protein
MSVKRETSEQCDAGNVGHLHCHRAILRKRILAALALLLMVLMFTIHNYHRSTNLRGSVDWLWFGGGGVMMGVWLGLAVAQFLRKGAKS